MYAGVILSDVLASHTTTIQPLSFVFSCFFGGNRPSFEEIILNRNPEKIHQNGIIREMPYHQIVINTFIVYYTKLIKVNFFRTRCQGIVPIVVKMLQSFCKSNHVMAVKFLISYTTFVKMHFDTLIRGYIRITEYHFLCVALQLVANYSSFLKQIIHRYLVSEN